MRDCTFFSITIHKVLVTPVYTSFPGKVRQSLKGGVTAYFAPVLGKGNGPTLKNYQPRRLPVCGWVSLDY